MPPSPGDLAKAAANRVGMDITMEVLAKAEAPLPQVQPPPPGQVFFLPHQTPPRSPSQPVQPVQLQLHQSPSPTTKRAPLHTVETSAEDVAVNAAQLECGQCHELKPKKQFSQKEWSKSSFALERVACRACIQRNIQTQKEAKDATTAKKAARRSARSRSPHRGRSPADRARRRSRSPRQRLGAPRPRPRSPPTSKAERRPRSFPAGGRRQAVSPLGKKQPKQHAQLVEFTINNLAVSAKGLREGTLKKIQSMSGATMECRADQGKIVLAGSSNCVAAAEKIIHQVCIKS
jgi:hypothetical protein